MAACRDRCAVATPEAEWSHFADFTLSFWRHQLASAVDTQPAALVQHLSSLSARPPLPADSLWERFMASATAQALAGPRLYPSLSGLPRPQVRCR